jgi:hypothetical protein
MKYTKPAIVAQSGKQNVLAAACGARMGQKCSVECHRHR